MFGKILCFFGHHSKKWFSAGNARHCARCRWWSNTTFQTRMRHALGSQWR